MEKQKVTGRTCKSIVHLFKRIYSLRIKFTGILVLFLVAALQVFAQSNDHEVSGTVTEANGEPLIGVNVFVQGTTIGTTTNMDGDYFLSVPDSDVVLVYSYIGYRQQQIAVEGKDAIRLMLY